MKRFALAACISLFGSFGVVPLGHTGMDRNYALQKDSHFEEGCFAPCMCPVLMHDDLRGRFSLIPIGTDNGYEVFEVRNLRWFESTWNSSTTEIKGSGTYRVSQSAKLQRMELDLWIGNRDREHYDSGLVPLSVLPPLLEITISRNGQYCWDTVFYIDAAPTPNDLRPPPLQFEDRDEERQALTTWGRLKKLWVP